MKWSERDRNRPIADHVLMELSWLLAFILILVVIVVSFTMYRANVRRDREEAILLAAVTAKRALDSENNGQSIYGTAIPDIRPAMEVGFVQGWAWYRLNRDVLYGGLIRHDDAEDGRELARSCLKHGQCEQPELGIGPPWRPSPFRVIGVAEDMGENGLLLLQISPREAAIVEELRSPWLIGYLLVLVICLTALGWWRLRTLISVPLGRLIEAMRQVENGDFSVRAEEHTCREVVELVSQFNGMTAALGEKSVELESRLHQLEGAYSQLKRAQDEAIQSEKLAGIGRLAAGIAHEVGNPLASMTGFAELLQDETLDPETRKDLFRRMQDELARTDRIIRGLLDYARTGSGVRIMFEPAQAVSHALELCRGRKLFDRLEVNYKNSSVLSSIGDPGQVEQIVVNLMLNAADAIRDTGQIEVEVRDSADRRWIEIRVRDTGGGIAEEDLGKVFDPFYTTKEPGKGTGLGLAVSSRLAASHGGSLSVERSSSSGTVFLLRLPSAVPGQER